MPGGLPQKRRRANACHMHSQRFFGFLLYGVLAILCLTGCWQSGETGAFLPEIPKNMGGELPFPEQNPFTREGVELGRALFYDPMLSANGKVACASCHEQRFAFSDGEALAARGVSGKPLLRNSPPLFNLAWHGDFFWDGGAKNLESLVFAPLTHPDEMGADLTETLQKLQEHPVYPAKFKAAFGTDSIQSALVARAIAQFLRTLVSTGSRYDRYMRREPGAHMNKEELKGLRLTMQKCGACHNSEHFSNFQHHNIGLDSVFSQDHEGMGQGRYRISLDKRDLGAYKTPSLRNLAVTGPYMHDGRYATLEEAVAHYDSAVLVTPSLSWAMYTDGKPNIALAPEETTAIVAFLHTLTDSAFLGNPVYAPPKNFK